MMKLQRQIAKYAFLVWFGGSTYVTLEVFWRARSHWTMFVLAAVVFIMIGLLNEIWAKWNLLVQTLVGTGIATVLEFITGLVVNVILRWNVWDYSNLPGNIMGQMCPQFMILWALIVVVAIILDDVIRWKFFDEEKPHYTIF